MPSSRPLSIGVAQLQPGADVEDNLERIRELTRRAGQAGTELLVFPELSVTGWGKDKVESAALAEPLDGRIVSELTTLADATEVTIVAGFYEKSAGSDPRPYNTLVAVAPSRGLVATHRKSHLYDAWGYRESDEVQAGAGDFAVFSVGDVRVGLINCYEIRFPERAFALLESGCDLLAISAAWARGPLKEEHWLVNVKARAIENTVWVAAASLTGPEVIGHSLIVDPFGVERVHLDEASDDWAGALADPERAATAQRALPIREQRRLAYYEPVE